jgi:hypothetical protein
MDRILRGITVMGAVEIMRTAVVDQIFRSECRGDPQAEHVSVPGRGSVDSVIDRFDELMTGLVLVDLLVSVLVFLAFGFFPAQRDAGFFPVITLEWK